MDAAEDDQDVKLQRASADLLADFQSSLKPFLWKTTKSGKSRVRDRVRVRDTARLANLVRYCDTILLRHTNCLLSSNPSKNFPNSSILTLTNSCQSSQMHSLLLCKPLLRNNHQRMPNYLCRCRKPYASFYTRSARSEGTK